MERFGWISPAPNTLRRVDLWYAERKSGIYRHATYHLYLNGITGRWEQLQKPLRIYLTNVHARFSFKAKLQHDSKSSNESGRFFCDQEHAGRFVRQLKQARFMNTALYRTEISPIILALHRQPTSYVTTIYKESIVIYQYTHTSSAAIAWSHPRSPYLRNVATTSMHLWSYTQERR